MSPRSVLAGCEVTTTAEEEEEEEEEEEDDSFFTSETLFPVSTDFEDTAEEVSG